jgi:hypothetical protein
MASMTVAGKFQSGRSIPAAQNLHGQRPEAGARRRTLYIRSVDLRPGWHTDVVQVE